MKLAEVIKFQQDKKRNSSIIERLKWCLHKNPCNNGSNERAQNSKSDNSSKIWEERFLQDEEQNAGMLEEIINTRNIFKSTTAKHQISWICHEKDKCHAHFLKHKMQKSWTKPISQYLQKFPMLLVSPYVYGTRQWGEEVIYTYFDIDKVEQTHIGYQRMLCKLCTGVQDTYLMQYMIFLVLQVHTWYLAFCRLAHP